MHLYPAAVIRRSANSNQMEPFGILKLALCETTMLMIEDVHDLRIVSSRNALEARAKDSLGTVEVHLE
jgi:hypothetical protein